MTTDPTSPLHTVPAPLAPQPLAFEINGDAVEVAIEPRKLLSDVIRHDLGLTGTHVGCEHGVCGTCTVLVDDAPVRSCLMLGIQAAGRRITTIEGVTPAEGLHPVQQALHEAHGLQCGFCTAGFVITLVSLAAEEREVTPAELTDHLSGHLCRCTGYRNIITAATKVLERGES
jgi:aerobic carbon-monoxide dehydrogenase small subunit